MPRAKWVVGVLTAGLLFTGMGVLRSTEGAKPVAATAGDALPSRALGLSGPRRLVQQLEHSGGHAPGKGARRPVRAGVGPLRPARPLRLSIPSLRVDVPLTTEDEDLAAPESAAWDTAEPAPGSAGTAVISGEFLHLAELRRGATIEVARADRRTAVFTVYRVSPAGITGRGQPPARAQLRLVSGETAVLARLTGQFRSPR
ncbi:class F sortase [Streptomyces sp. NPDC051183]|uniref:class F sortase n=1 Tax=unclassified Streptomyces TaxID=2593676 RepID=UPI003414D66B